MKLKCIGGELDGQSFDVDERRYCLRNNEPVQIRKPLSLSVSLPMEEQATIKYYTYKVFIMHFNERNEYSEVRYLIPNDWTSREAVLFQFGK